MVGVIADLSIKGSSHHRRQGATGGIFAITWTRSVRNHPGAFDISSASSPGGSDLVMCADYLTHVSASSVSNTASSSRCLSISVSAEICASFDAICRRQSAACFWQTSDCWTRASTAAAVGLGLRLRFDIR